MSRRTGVLVVGGGITGLAAAWECVRAGVPVTVAEAGPAFGGKVSSERVHGFVIEHGPDSFVAYRPAALAIIGELGMGAEVIGVTARRAVHLRVDGRLHPLPDGMGMVLPRRLGPFVTTRILRPHHKLRAGLDLVMPRRLGPQDTSIGAFLRSRLGDGVVERFAEPMVGGIYGAGVDDLSLDAVLPTLRASEQRHRSLMLASLAEGRAAAPPRGRTRNAAPGTPAQTPPGRGGTGAPPGAPPSPFRSLSRGMGSLPEGLVHALREAGAALLTGSPVVGLERRGSAVLASLGDESRAGIGSGPAAGPRQDAGPKDVVWPSTHFEGVVLAVGAAPMGRLLEPHAPQASAALRGIPHTTSTVVTLALPESGFGEPPTAHGWLEAGPAPISGATISSAKWPGRAPDGVVLVRAFVPQRLGPLAAAEEATLVGAVLRHVEAVLGFRGAPILTRVTRWSAAMPVYTVGHLERAASVDAAVAQLPGWAVAGSALHGVGVPECIADGRRAAQAVIDRIGSDPTA